MPNAMTLVAYSGPPNFVVSAPRIVRSSNPGMTGGAGRVQSLTLIARYDRGVLASLLWSDPWTCPSDQCSASNCISGVYCARAESDCVSLLPNATVPAGF